MNKRLRRIVTGQTGAGGSIIADDVAPVVELGGGARVHEVWRAPHATGEEAPGTPWSLNPPAGGAVFRIAEFPPLGAGDVPAFMHITRTIDFGVVLEGELTLIMDGEETLLRAGDTFVQRQANHGWENRAATRCMMAVVLIDGAL
jgi:mannose-6-phosphate isomerase-like protein (cupin superfamily)